MTSRRKMGPADFVYEELSCFYKEWISAISMRKAPRRLRQADARLTSHCSTICQRQFHDATKSYRGWQQSLPRLVGAPQRPLLD